MTWEVFQFELGFLMKQGFIGKINEEMEIQGQEW